MILINRYDTPEAICPKNFRCSPDPFPINVHFELKIDSIARNRKSARSYDADTCALRLRKPIQLLNLSPFPNNTGQALQDTFFHNALVNQIFA